MHDCLSCGKYKRTWLFRILSCLLLVVIMFCTACFNEKIPANYIARSYIGDHLQTNLLGIPAEPQEGQIIYIYRNKSYLIETRNETDEGYTKDIGKRVSVDDWNELMPVLGESVIMEEGDVAVFSKGEFIRYAEAVYP